jgi:hypothetical protein
VAAVQLRVEAKQILAEQLRFCEEQHLDEGAAYFRKALESWDQAEYESWERIDDLSAHPKNRAELHQFREWDLMGLGEKDIRPS